MSETIEAIVLRRNVSTVAQLESGALALNTAQWGLATAEDTMVARDDAGNFHYFYGSDRIEAEIVSILAETDHNDLGGRTLADCHPISSITGLTSTLADKLSTSLKGAANGLAELGADGKVPTAQLPALLTLGETETTAYRGDRGKTAYDHSQLTTGNPHGTTKSDIGLGNVNNTSDADKPISAATQTALNGKAPTNHASAATTYGVGSETNYGHVKLYTSTGTSTDGAMDRNSVTNALGLKANSTDLANYVTLAGTQTITGEKTFSAGWVAPYAWMGTSTNGIILRNFGTTYFGIWRRGLSVEDDTNFAFLASDATTLINAPTTVGMYIADSARVYLTADETTLLAGSGDNLNRVTLRRYPSGTATAMYVGVPWSSQTTTNYRFYFGTASTEINNPTAVCLAVNNVTTLKASSGEVNVYSNLGVLNSEDTYGCIRLSTNIDSLNYVGIGFGVGTSARDTYLFRYDVNALRTPGSLNVVGEFTTNASVMAGGSVLCTKQFRIGAKNTVASAANVNVTGKSFIAFTGTTTTTLTGGTEGCLYVLTSGDSNSRNINFTCQGGSTRTIFVARCWPLIVVAYGSGVFEPLSA